MAKNQLETIYKEVEIFKEAKLREEVLLSSLNNRKYNLASAMVEWFEEKDKNSCIESLFTDIIPLVLKCSFAFMTGGVISNWKFLLIGIM